MSAAWILAAVMGLLTSAFVVDQYLGISSVAMTAVSVYVIYRYKKKAGLTLGRHFYMIGSYMMLLSLVLMVTTVPVIRFWSCVILVILTMALTVCENEFLWPKWIGAALKVLGGSMARMGAFFSAGRNVTSEGKKQIGQILLGLLISIPILAVAAGLLSSADRYMEIYLEDFFDGFQLDDAGVWIWRAIVFFVVASLMFGMSLWFAREKTMEELREPADVEVIPPTVSGTILLLLNLLYLFFAYIQFRFLFLGAVNTQASGYDYAEYARSGFFELVLLAVMNTVGILIINRFTKNHLFNRISLTVTAGCTFVMIASSWYKMFLYEQAYGYTQLRLYVYLILAFMVVFMALITLGIWQRQYHVVEWAIVIGLCYFLVIGFVNVDAVIVRNNMERYYKEDQIDLYYLMNCLSEDAVPELMDYIKKDPVLLNKSVHEVYRNDSWDGEYTSTYSGEDMIGYYEEMQSEVVNNHQERQFFEFNLRHWLAYRAASKEMASLASETDLE